MKLNNCRDLNSTDLYLPSYSNRLITYWVLFLFSTTFRNPQGVLNMLIKLSSPIRYWQVWWLFLCVMRGFLDEINIHVGERRVKQNALHSVGRPFQSKAWTEQKDWFPQARDNSPVGCLWISSASSALLGLQPVFPHCRFWTAVSVIIR